MAKEVSKRDVEGTDKTEGVARKSGINQLGPQKVLSFIKIRVDLAEIQTFLDIGDQLTNRHYIIQKLSDNELATLFS